jgi:hypothetical protein
MTTDNPERIEACIQELAALLYEEADKSQLVDLEGIEKTVHRQIQHFPIIQGTII